MKTALVAIAYIVATPIVFGLLAAAFTFGMHWLSGEGNVRASGDPWLMIGAMLIFPLSVLIGLVSGIMQAINAIYDSVTRTP